MKITKGRLRQIIDEEVARLSDARGFGNETEVGSSDIEAANQDFEVDSIKKKLYAKSKQQIEDVLNTLWDDLYEAGLKAEGEANIELAKLLDRLIRDLDSGFIGEPT